MKRIAEASIPDLFGRVLLALSLFYGAGGTLWKIFGLDTLRTAWMVQVFTGTALCVFLCAVTKKRVKIFIYIFVAVVLSVVAALMSGYISDGWSVVFNRLFSGFELRYGRIFPFFKSGLTKADPDLCASLFLTYPTTLLAVCAAQTACVRSIWRFAFAIGALFIWGAAVVFRLPVSGGAPVLFLFAIVKIRTRAVSLKTITQDGGRILLPALLTLALLVGMLALPVAVLLGDREASAERLRDKAAFGIHKIRYHSQAGPMPEGDLAGLEDFEPEEGTALYVTMREPKNLYLKGYIGEEYTSSGWSRLEPETLGKYATTFSWLHEADFFGQTQYAAAASALDGQNKTESIKIENESACSAYVFIPYELKIFVQPLDKNMIGDSFVRARGWHGERSYEYEKLTYGIENYATLYTQLFDEQHSGIGSGYEYLSHEGAYREFVYNEYLDVPYTAKTALLRLKELAAVPEDMQISFSDARRIVLTCLLNNFVYDEHPGKAPEGWDFVQWFVEKAQSGYAPHFATTATLMFRLLGVPARYVEGYAIRENEVHTAQNGRMAIPNANAHAWVEIYRDGVGWIPFEVTPPFVAEMPEATANGEAGGSGSSEIAPEPEKQPEEDSSLSLAQILVTVALALIILLAVAFAGLYFRRRTIMKKRDRLLKDPSNAKAVCWQTAYAVMLLEHIGISRGNRSLFALIPEVDHLLGSEIASEFTAVIHTQRAAMFSDEEIGDSGLDRVHLFTVKILEELKKTSKRRERIRLKWILCIY